MSTINYDIKLSKKRKTVAIIINKSGLIRILAPYRCEKKYIENFVEKKKDWILKTVNKILERKCYHAINENLENNANFYYLGNKYTLKIENYSKNKIEIVNNEIIVVYVKNKSFVKKTIENFLRKSALKFFYERLNICFFYFSSIVNCTIPILKVRNMKRTYGSMFSSGIILLNIKLIYANFRIIDYIIMHELCHIKHKNHGKNFYYLLTKVLPDWKLTKQETKKFYNENNESF